MKKDALKIALALTTSGCTKMVNNLITDPILNATPAASTTNYYQPLTFPDTE